MTAPVSPPQAVAVLLATELKLVLRRGETLVATGVIPVAILLFFASLSILPTGTDRPVDFLLPGAIALAVIATSLVSLGITTAFDRSYGVLKRLGGAPVSRAEVLVAKVAAVIVVEIVQIGLLLAAATFLLGWTLPAGASVGGLIVAVLLGTLAFAGLGLLLAGTLRADTTLAVANGLFIAFLLLGGIVVPIDHLPGPLAALAAALPAAALSDALRVAIGPDGATRDASGSLALLAGWGVVTAVLATKTFRWE